MRKIKVNRNRYDIDIDYQTDEFKALIANYSKLSKLELLIKKEVWINEKSKLEKSIAFNGSTPKFFTVLSLVVVVANSLDGGMDIFVKPLSIPAFICLLQIVLPLMMAKYIHESNKANIKISNAEVNIQCIDLCLSNADIINDIEKT